MKKVFFKLILLGGLLTGHTPIFSQSLPQRLVPLSDPVYALLDYYELAGYTGYLPQAKPYTRQMVHNYLLGVMADEYLPEQEKIIIRRLMDDLQQETRALVVKRADDGTPAVLGVAAQAGVRAGAGEGSSWSTVNIAEPFITGSLGSHISYLAGIGLSVERHAPDIFFQSYVKNGQVHFPNHDVGYSWHPYQFQYPTMWNHVRTSVTTGGGPPVQEALTAGMLYHAELSGSWLSNRLQLHLHNHYRSWGYRSANLFLSERARRFPGLDLILTPTSWLRYSWVTGTLFAYANQSPAYKADLYGYDLGHPQKMFSLHQLEITLTPKLQATLLGGNIWSKRFEPAYLMPFVLPHLAQIEVGDHDNLSIGASLAWLCSCSGKFHVSLFVDEFSFLDEGNLLRMPRNRYAWQAGWSRQVPPALLPMTTFDLTLTRVGPFVYTHYPETEFVPYGGGRPVDLTYTHDEFNLGFYLPPNSGELQLKLTNLAIPDLLLTLDNKFIAHGTNDLAGDPYQIFGDVYRHQYGPVGQYPLMDFTKDGIYDYTWMSELKFDKRIHDAGLVESFRLVGTLGFSRTWWRSHQSGVAAPGSRNLLTGSLSVLIAI
ncbi:MAG: hypothetical protein WDA19_12850 [Mariniphaga sp.]